MHSVSSFVFVSLLGLGTSGAALYALRRFLKHITALSRTYGEPSDAALRRQKYHFWYPAYAVMVLTGIVTVCFAAYQFLL